MKGVKKEQRGLDAFKLVVLLGLIVSLFLTITQQEQGMSGDAAHPEMKYAPAPVFPFALYIDETEGALQDEMGVVYFSWNETEKGWRAWQSDTELLFHYDEERLQLVDRKGEAKYFAREAGEGWVPFIPEAISATLPEAVDLTRDESRVWTITNGESEPLYVFNAMQHTWEVIAPLEPEEETMLTEAQCSSLNPSRIPIGSSSQLRVINALVPLRETPQVMDDNIITSLEPGEVLLTDGKAVCEPYLTGANLWWLVRDGEGREGWVAEASAISPVYYLEVILP